MLGVFKDSKFLFVILFLLINLVSCNQIGKISGANQTINRAVSLTLPNIVLNEGDSTTVVLTFSEPAKMDFILRWTMVGSGSSTDFPIVSGTIPVTAGDTSVMQLINTNENLITDGIRNYTLEIDSVSGLGLNNTSASFTVNDDEPVGNPTISIANVSSNEGNGGGTTTYTFTVSTSFAAGHNVIVDYTTNDGTATTADSDYNQTTSTLTIPSGSNSGTINVTINRDAKFESNETFTLDLSGGSGYTLAGSTMSATGTITNDDTVPTVQWSVASQSITESGGSATITAQLSMATGVAVSIPFTLSGTATGSGTDYSVTASPITIAAGSLSTTATVTIVNDAAIESQETVVVTMGTPTNASAGATTTHTVSINDNDLGTFAISGIRSSGGLDSITDTYLNYEATPSILFATSTGATSYDVTVFAIDESQ